MKSRSEDRRSIFPEDFSVLQDIQSAADILGEMELLSSRAVQNERHILSRDVELEDRVSERSDIADLIRSGYKLPEVESVEMLLSSDKAMDRAEENETPPGGDNFKDAPYRMVNLISGSYRLPEIDDSFFR